MKCPYCNHQNEVDAKYCSECGMPLFKKDKDNEKISTNDKAEAVTDLSLEEELETKYQKLVYGSRMELYHSRTEQDETDQELVKNDGQTEFASIKKQGICAIRISQRI